MTEQVARVSAHVTSTDDERPCIVVAGELDFSNTFQVRGLLDSVLADGAEQLVFDLAKLNFMDSSGLAVLVYAANHCAVQLHRPTSVVRRVIEVTGLEGSFKITE